jgi:Tol biopolymer transport system component
MRRTAAGTVLLALLAASGACGGSAATTPAPTTDGGVDDALADDAPAAPEERIAYIVAASNATPGPLATGDVYTVKPDGTNLTPITTSGDAAFAAWSRDGRRIAYVSLPTRNQPNVWVMDADGTNKSQVTHQGGLMPSWAPDGTILFMRASIDGGPSTEGLFAIQADGTGERPVRDGAYFGSFSSDGTKIVYTGKVQTDRLHNEIFTMNADGSNSTQLTFPDQDANAPDANASSWSPDGKQIAFFCGYEGDLPNLGPYYDKGYQQVCLMNADGSNRHRLTSCTMCGSDNPGWSPDGTRVFFDRGVEGKGIFTYIIDVDGTNEHQLLPVSYGGGRLPWRR